MVGKKGSILTGIVSVHGLPSDSFIITSEVTSYIPHSWNYSWAQIAYFLIFLSVKEVKMPPPHPVEVP